MNNAVLQLKIKERLNKLDSQDYDNIECWQIVEAFNKAQVEWCRRQLHGYNVFKEGDEQSKRRVDDLQILLNPPLTLTMSNKQVYWDSSLPADYLEWKRVTAFATSECCPDPRRMVVYLAEEGNVDELLRDKNKRPDFDWGETFVTLAGNTLRVYTDNRFSVASAELTYYRQPLRIEITGCANPFTNTTPIVDVVSEFKDDIVELMIDDAASILAGDIESSNQFGRGSQSSDKNN